MKRSFGYDTAPHPTAARLPRRKHRQGPRALDRCHIPSAEIHRSTQRGSLRRRLIRRSDCRGAQRGIVREALPPPPAIPQHQLIARSDLPHAGDRTPGLVIERSPNESASVRQRQCFILRGHCAGRSVEPYVHGCLRIHSSKYRQDSRRLPLTALVYRRMESIGDLRMPAEKSRSYEK